VSTDARPDTPSDAGPRDDHDARARAAAARLLSRTPPPGYLDAWARALTRTQLAAEGADLRRAVLVRLGDDLYALEAGLVREVHRPQRVHRVPGRSNEVFRGLVSLRGELVLCADLHALLGAERPARTLPTSRIVRASKDGQAWAFEVDEVLEVVGYDAARVSQPQVTVAKAAVHFTDGLFPWGDRHVARLDAERFFGGLARSLT
jgi:chemotaxis-related protein WspD